jgi:hypothetical protein
MLRNTSVVFYHILLRQDLDVGATDETLGADPAALAQERAALAPVGLCHITLLANSGKHVKNHLTLLTSFTESNA